MGRNAIIAGNPTTSRQSDPRSWRVWLGRLRYNTINGVQALGIVPGPVRARMLRLLGHKLSAGTFVDRHVEFMGAGLTTEGSVSINVGSMINASGPIHIEDGVRIACRVMLITETHEVGPSAFRAGTVELRPIRIERGCWIGAGATVLPGVTVASGCIVAAGAVVAESTVPNGLYAGVPARRVKDLVVM